MTSYCLLALLLLDVFLPIAALLFQSSKMHLTALNATLDPESNVNATGS